MSETILCIKLYEQKNVIFSREKKPVFVIIIYCLIVEALKKEKEKEYFIAFLLLFMS